MYFCATLKIVCHVAYLCSSMLFAHADSPSDDEAVMMLTSCSSCTLPLAHHALDGALLAIYTLIGMCSDSALYLRKNPQSTKS